MKNVIDWAGELRAAITVTDATPESASETVACTVTAVWVSVAPSAGEVMAT